MRPALVLFVLSGLACAGVCERSEVVGKEFQERHAACFPEGTLPSPAFDAVACKSSMKACSDSDEQAVHHYLDCVEQLPTCTDARRAYFNERFMACTTGMNRLGEGCFRP